MPLANGLASAVDTFVAVRNENRRSQLHDLKVEGAGLVNEGRRMDNTFARESYGARLRQEQGAAEWQTGRGRVAQSQARTDEQIEDEGLLVNQERQKTRYERNRANYWDSRSVSAASDARVSSNTEQARIDTQRSKADKAFQDALSAARGNRNGVVKGLRAELNNVVGNRSLSEAVRDERFQANVVPLLEIEYEDYLSPGQTIEGLVSMGPGQFGVAARMPDGSIKPITTNRSADPDDSVLVISEDEVAAFVLGAGAEDYRAFQAQSRIVRDDIEEDRDDSLEQNAVSVYGAGIDVFETDKLAPEVRVYTSNRAAIEESIASVEQEIEEAKVGLTPGQGRGLGSGPAGSILTDSKAKLKVDDLQLRRDSLLKQLDSLDASAEEAGIGDFQTMERFLDEQDKKRKRLASLRGQPPQIVQQSKNDLFRAGQALDAGVSFGDVRTSLGNDDDPTVSLANRTAARNEQEESVEAVRTIVDDVTANLSGLADRDKKNDGPGFQMPPEQAKIQMEGWLAENPRFYKAASEAFSGQNLRAMFSDAGFLAMQSGKPVSLHLNSVLRFSNQNAYSAMSLVYEDDFWDSDEAPQNEVGRSTRLDAAMFAAQVLETGRASTPEIARDLALLRIQRGNSLSDDGRSPRGSSSAPSRY